MPKLRLVEIVVVLEDLILQMTFNSSCFFPFEASCASKTTTKSSTSYVLNFFNCGSCITPFCFSVVSRSSKSSSLSSGSSSSVVSVSQNGNYALISVTRCVIKLLHPCINCKLEQKKSLRELEIVVNGERASCIN